MEDSTRSEHYHTKINRYDARASTACDKKDNHFDSSCFERFVEGYKPWIVKECPRSSMLNQVMWMPLIQGEALSSTW